MRLSDAAAEQDEMELRRRIFMIQPVSKECRAVLGLVVSWLAVVGVVIYYS